ncbi:MAG: hypothetical protein ABIR55_17200, partial [Burkholderiaceae bacterium]
PLRPLLPQHVDAVMGALHSGMANVAAAEYLRHAMDVATRHIYLGMLVVAVCIVLLVLRTPRHFVQVDEAPPN